MTGAVPVFFGYLADDAPGSDVVVPAAVAIPGDSLAVTVTKTLFSGGLNRYVNASDVLLQVQGVLGANRTLGRVRSPWLYTTAVIPGAYSPEKGVSFTPVCVMAGVEARVYLNENSYVRIRWEYYDTVLSDWVTFVPWPNVFGGYSIPLLAPTSYATYRGVDNHFTYIGSRTDGQTRIFVENIHGEVSPAVPGPDISAWCGFDAIAVAPTMSAQASGYTPSFYYLSASADELVRSQFRYRVDGGAWSAWSAWSAFDTMVSASYVHAPRDQAVDFELFVEDQDALNPTPNPLTASIPPTP